MRRIVEKLGLVDAPHMESEEIPQELLESDECVELVFGNATEVFNSHKGIDYYYFAVRGAVNTPVIITININDYPLVSNSKKRSKIKSDSLLDFEIFKYYNCKGPPTPCVS